MFYEPLPISVSALVFSIFVSLLGLHAVYVFYILLPYHFVGPL